MITTFILKDEFGQDLTEITIDENNKVIDCKSSDIYKDFLIGKWIVNGFTKNNNTGKPIPGEPIYFIDSPKAATYCILKTLDGRSFEIEAIKRGCNAI